MKTLSIVMALVASIAWSRPAAAIVGDAPNAGPGVAWHLVKIVRQTGMACTGTIIAPDLVLTAAHCLLSPMPFRIAETDPIGQDQLIAPTKIVLHPHISEDARANRPVTIDLALIKLARPVSAPLAPVRLSPRTEPLPDGGRLTIAGFGVGVTGDPKTLGRAREAVLAYTGRGGYTRTVPRKGNEPRATGGRMELVDPDAREGLGRGSCAGDSGGPVIDLSNGAPAVIGVIQNSAGPNGTAGCGARTYVEPIGRYLEWIETTAKSLGSQLGERPNALPTARRGL